MRDLHMSPKSNIRGKKIVVISNIYTALLALALGAVCGAAVFVAFKCLTQYEVIFKIAQVGH